MNERTCRSPSSPSASASVSTFLAGFFSALGVAVFFPPLASVLAAATGAFFTPLAGVASTLTGAGAAFYHLFEELLLL